MGKYWLLHEGFQGKAFETFEKHDTVDGREALREYYPGKYS